MIRNGGTLLVVGPSEGLEQALVARAAQISEAMGLAVYCYHPLTLKPAPAALPGIPAALTGAANAVQSEQTRELRHASCKEALQTRLARLRARGIDADGLVEWRLSRIPAVLEKIDEISPELVMTAAEPHGRLAEVFGLDDDLELVRRCPLPVWTVRGGHRDGKVVLAGADPTHEDDRACPVDHAVLDEAVELARALGKEAHVIHTYTLPTRLPSVIETAAPDVAHERYQQADDHHTRRTHELARAHGIRPEHTQVVHGDFVETVRDMIEPLEVDVVVTGATSRSRIERMLVGATAEKLLRTIDIDVLVVKAGAETVTNPH